METADASASSDAALGAPESPSGKGAGDENFPVASLLIRPALRPHIRTYYAFARAIDDIADSPVLSPTEKLARLDAFEAALTGPSDPPPGYGKAAALRASLAATGVPACHATDLIAAFRQDATQSRYADWDGLMGYCRLSANPVGRYLLALHGEGQAACAASDALCSALQVLNHLQDCGVDYRSLGRVYLPLDWMQAEGATVEDLSAKALTPGLRRVLDRMLDRCDGLIATAAPMGRLIRDRRLAAEAAVIVGLARRLSARLRRQDPLAARVALSKGNVALAAASGLWQAVLPRWQVQP